MKKKIFMLIAIAFLMFYAPSVLAVNITGCEANLPGIVIDAKIPNTVHTIIVVIKIAVPILLVVLGMIDLFKGITAQKEDEMKKAQGIFVKRLISAAIVFFVVAIVQVLVSFVAGDEGIMTCANCFINGVKKDGSCK